MTIQEELKKWAKNAFMFYQELDRKETKGFYTQTPLVNITSSPDIVVMGINPGSNGKFDSNFNYELFMKGNFDEWKDHRNWKYTRRIEDFLRRGLGNNAENIFSNDNRIVYINASCFQTKKAGALGYNLLIKSLPSTIDLIRKLNPRLLLCLSAKKIFGIEQSFEREYLTEDVLIGQLENIQIKEGDMVEEGAYIADVAAPTKYYSVEGDNIYFALKKDGEPVNPMTKLK